MKEYNAGYDYGYVCVEFSLLEDAIGCMEANQGTLMIHDKEVTPRVCTRSGFLYCKRCKSSTGGHRSSCSFYKCPREESKQVLITYPQPQKTSIPASSEKQPNQLARPADKESNPGSGKKDKNHAWDIKSEKQKGVCLILAEKGPLSEETEKRNHGLETYARMGRAKQSC